ncbi:MAG TPA: hypothetical protein VHL77_08505 [Ferruginibacter sp.]|jgi:hypothetical protein|nr:hypothetical protein [Ferruginibacter sp.]
MRIQKFLPVMLMIAVSQTTNAQLKATVVCPPFKVDVMSGTVNDLYPKSAIGEIQETLPCYSETIIHDSASVCGGVFYNDKGVLFYTDRRYIEINEKFKGKVTPALMGASRTALFSILGHPKIKDANWDAFQMGYGTLILYYNKAGKINKIQMSTRTTETIKLCE